MPWLGRGCGGARNRKTKENDRAKPPFELENVLRGVVANITRPRPAAPDDCAGKQAQHSGVSLVDTRQVEWRPFA